MFKTECGTPQRSTTAVHLKQNFTERDIYPKALGLRALGVSLLIPDFLRTNSAFSIQQAFANLITTAAVVRNCDRWEVGPARCTEPFLPRSEFPFPSAFRY